MIYFEERVHKRPWKRSGMDDLLCPRMLSLIPQRMGFIPEGDLEVRSLVREQFGIKEWRHFISHCSNPTKERAGPEDGFDDESERDLEEDHPKMQPQQPFGASIPDFQSKPPLQEILSTRLDYMATSMDDLQAAQIVRQLAPPPPPPDA